MSLILDASVALTWALKDERDESAARILTRCEAGSAVVPALFFTEVMNALMMAERRGRISFSESDVFVAKLKTLDIRVQPGTLAYSEQALFAARSEQLTVYDASYLCLAQRLDLPLARFDSALRRAAERRHIMLL